MNLVVVVLRLQGIDCLLPVRSQDVARWTSQTLIDLNLNVSLVIVTLK